MNSKCKTQDGYKNDGVEGLIIKADDADKSKRDQWTAKVDLQSGNCHEFDQSKGLRVSTSFYRDFETENKEQDVQFVVKGNVVPAYNIMGFIY